MTSAPAAVSPSQASAAAPRWIGLLYLALTLLYLVPIWSVAHVPTTDGPSHLYNAWVMVHLHDPHYPLFARYYELDFSPIPNWFCFAVLAGLLQVMSPLLAEKVVVSAIVVLLLAGFWYLAGSVRGDRRWVAFLGFPFVYTLPFSFGFYNFCFSLAFYMFAIAFWWRRRERPDWPMALALNGILLLCYSSHIISLLLGLATIGVLWLFSFRTNGWRVQLGHVLILVPQLVLPVIWMAPHQGNGLGWSDAPVRQQLAEFIRLDTLWTFLAGGRAPQELIAAAFALLILATLGHRIHRRAERSDAPGAPGAPDAPDTDAAGSWRGVAAEDGFFCAALLLVLGYVISPDAAAGGSFIKMRLVFYPFLAVIPWLAPGWRGAGRALTVGLLAALALFDVGVVWKTYRRVDPLVSKFVESVDLVARDHRIMPLFWAHDGFGQRPGIFGHTLDYVAVDKGLIDWDNYEATSALFPVHFKDGLYRPDPFAMEARPENLAVGEAAAWVDDILTWRLPPESPLNGSLAPYYEPTFKLDGLQLYRRRSTGAVP